VQLGNILLAHTKNIDLAKSNLEKAVIHTCIFVLFNILYIIYNTNKDAEIVQP
jgi:hypothetical protein